MHVGICGYPGSGKTTVFRALAPGGKADREIAYGNIKVPDERVDMLASLFHPKKTTYAEITFVDVGSGSRSGSVFPPAVLQGMRNADVIVHVVRGFENSSLSTPPDPPRDERTFDEELLLLDLGTLEKRRDRFKKESKKGLEVEVNAKMIEHLEKSEPLRTLELSEEEIRAIGPGIQLLSMQPLITLYNLSEEVWNDASKAALRETVRGNSFVRMSLCGSIEAEIAALPAEEQADFLEGLGLGEPARNVFVREAYRLMDYISFLTAGTDECRAWPVRRGANARRAAGKIHSDLERGFIRAEVYRPEDLMVAGSEAVLKTQGKIRLEGKDYIVKDGDVMHVRAGT